MLRIAATDQPLTNVEADLVLLPGRAAFVPATGTLLVADVHLGKAATFRRAGIPVPEGSAQRDLARLVALAARHTARRVVVLGDLIHAKSGCTEAVLDEFRTARQRIAADVLLVLGNHDRGLGMSPATLAARLGIDACLPALDEPPFHLVHEPAADLQTPRRDLFTIGGHLHPTIAIGSPSGDRLADRCFVAEPSTLVLPAFGSFTGGHRVAYADGMRVWIARDDGVADVTAIVARSRRARRG
ncbi:MAG: ligase-associated DNA damage response endonuclease PdeM [Planctomycetia bacterium]